MKTVRGCPARRTWVGCAFRRSWSASRTTTRKRIITGWKAWSRSWTRTPSAVPPEAGSIFRISKNTGRSVFPKDKMYLMPYLNFGEQIKLFHESSYPVGVNMITRRDLLSRLGGFNEDLGPNYAKRRPISGKETDYCDRVICWGFPSCTSGRPSCGILSRGKGIRLLFLKGLRMELYTLVVFDLNCEPFYKYPLKTIFPLLRMVSHKLKGRTESHLDKYLLGEESKSYMLAFFRAPRSIRRSRKKLQALIH